jgi:hypothetical protein
MHLAVDASQVLTFFEFSGIGAILRAEKHEG